MRVRVTLAGGVDEVGDVQVHKLGECRRCGRLMTPNLIGAFWVPVSLGTPEGALTFFEPEHWTMLGGKVPRCVQQRQAATGIKGSRG